MNLSNEPEIALWITTGLSFSHCSLVNERSNLTGKLKSHWIVASCHSLQIASLNIKSSLGQ
jgi:hypothetical protein